MNSNALCVLYLLNWQMQRKTSLKYALLEVIWILDVVFTLQEKTISAYKTTTFVRR